MIGNNRLLLDIMAIALPFYHSLLNCVYMAWYFTGVGFTRSSITYCNLDGRGKYFTYLPFEVNFMSWLLQSIETIKNIFWKIINMKMLNQPPLNFNLPYQESWISNLLVQEHSFGLICLNHGGYYWHRFEQTNGNMCRRNFIAWSLSIVVVFGMTSEWTNLYGSFYLLSNVCITCLFVNSFHEGYCYSQWLCMKRIPFASYVCA